jgi:type II restriction enzyme
MNLSMTGSLAAAYSSGAQRARVVTEAWGEKNLFCPNCSSPKLTWLQPGHPASDYSCPRCGFWYQLKSQRAPIRDSITDGAYGAMMKAIRNDEAPSYYFMQYDLATWSVRNLLLVPHFAFPPSAIIKRKPLSVTARRAGWVGCNFSLSRIPAEARIWLVTTLGPQSSAAVPAASRPQVSPGRRDACATLIAAPKEVREKFQRVKPLKDISVKQRGWTLDVLNIVRRLGKPEFTNEEVYAFARELEKLHPDNRHVRDKIRQQLQVLRDAKLLIHLGSGLWRLP